MTGALRSLETSYTALTKSHAFRDVTDCNMQYPFMVILTLQSKF